MNIVGFGFFMFVHITLSYGLTGGNLCWDNDTHVRASQVCITSIYTSCLVRCSKILSRCCRNYEEKNNKCVGCRPGFFGSNCLQTCSENVYGNLCESICNCTETQICHHVCGCIRNSSSTNCSLSTENATSSYVSESDQGTLPNGFAFEYLVGAASVMSVCFLVGIWILYRMHVRNKKEERCSHHNVVYDLEEPPRIQENPNDYEGAAEHLYGTCSYEDTCYSTLTLRVDILGPCTSKQEVFNDDNVYELAYSFERQNDEEQTPHAFISNLSEAT